MDVLSIVLKNYQLDRFLSYYSRFPPYYSRTIYYSLSLVFILVMFKDVTAVVLTPLSLLFKDYHTYSRYVP